MNFRIGRRFFICLFSALAPVGFAEAPRALPVDPSDLVAGSDLPLMVSGGANREAKPLPAGEVRLAAPRSNPRSDSPEIANLPQGEDAVRLQIFLDQAHFGPGVIDGKPGRFTVLAVNSWNEAHGYPKNDLRAVMAEARRSVPNPFALAIVPEVSRKWVNSKLSYKRSEQARGKRMSYRSFGEFMSDSYHTDVDFLIELNDRTSVYGLQPNGSLIVPNVKPFLIENLSGASYQPEALLASRHMVIDTKLNQARIYEALPTALIVEDPEAPVQVRANRSLVAAFPITPGQERFIKYGLWEMKNAVQLPVWRYDQSLLDTGKRSSNALNIPPGPNSPVGVIWMGLSVSGIGVHGTSSPETIGRSRSAGCIRMANWDATRVPDFLRPGASVEIR
ncbi:MAG: L,D-transpeptidase [Verrucomicrobiales bacterium]